MSTVRSFFRSFSGGAVAPEFWGQIADAKFQTGLADADQLATDRARIAALARVEQGFRCLG